MNTTRAKAIKSKEDQYLKGKYVCAQSVAGEFFELHQQLCRLLQGVLRRRQLGACTGDGVMSPWKITLHILEQTKASVHGVSRLILTTGNQNCWHAVRNLHPSAVEVAHTLRDC